MHGETTFRDKTGVHESAHFCTFSTARFGQASCLVNLYFHETSHGARLAVPQQSFLMVNLGAIRTIRKVHAREVAAEYTVVFGHRS